MNNDFAFNETEKKLVELEKRINKIYAEASEDLGKTIKEYFDSFAERDAIMKRRLDAGEITKEYYTQWRLNQIGRGKRFEALQDKVADRATRANEVAQTYVNGGLPEIYALNRNYMEYTIEHTGADVSFNLWNEYVVKKAAEEAPDLMPYYPPERAINRGIDLQWGKSQISKVVTSSILQGLSIPHIADKLQKNIVDMNRTSAIRASRTAYTGAQNGARQDTLEAAAKMGIKMKKRWIATKDNRTRHEHGAADGQVVDYNKPFDVGGEPLMFPGDKSGSPWNVYNCRCSVDSGSDLEFEQEPKMIRVRNPVTGKNELVQDMTYKEWVEYHKKTDPKAFETYMKMGKNMSSDFKQYKQYQEILKSHAPNTFAEFQNVKYNNQGQWDFLKGFYKYRNRVPESTKDNYNKYLALKEIVKNGTIRVPAETIDINSLVFRDEHAKRHGCTLEDAKKYVDNAYCSIRKSRWDGVSVNYYSHNGASYIDPDSLQIKTSYPRKDFKGDIKQIMEVFEN